ncbi:Sugar transport protein [Musa troglodytarum]|uniref:Sugar transport protein n=1 Tax=Musa troglodytarum TaxID=320322 RepID=A0A9E7KZL9_9LILI|nr:Sugar transport protein [Musa troglodytarum]
MAAFGGVIFVYDLEISGGTTAMESFLQTFFPDTTTKMADAKRDECCVCDSQTLKAFTSSLYVSRVGRITCRRPPHQGRRMPSCHAVGGVFFLVGAAVDAAAVNVEILIVGRLLLGIDIGFTNQVSYSGVPDGDGADGAAGRLHLRLPVLHVRRRGAANFTNYGASHIPTRGWRLSLGLAAVPAAVIFVTTLLISDTPSSLVQRGKLEDARAALRRARGPAADVEAELEGIEPSVEESSKLEEGAFRRIVRRRYRPCLVMSVAIPMFQQLTGIVVVAFFSLVLFRTVGFGSDAALMNAVILGWSASRRSSSPTSWSTAAAVNSCSSWAEP